jgi:broad specificity phosphatase PhoE
MIRLARHGQTAYNAIGRFQGWLPVPLDDTGLAQARALAEECAPLEIRTLWCSPLLRARQTAAIVAERIGLEPRVEQRWAETDAGDWTDRLFADVAAEDPERFAMFQAVDPDFAFPGGESFAGHQARVAAALEDLRARTEDHPALVVCHGVTIRLALLASGVDGSARTMPLPNTALVTV